jgi:hypothetical protein
MLKKTLIATATAGLIAAGSLVGTAGSASAAGIQFGGPGWHVGIGGGPGWGWNKPRYVCQPVFKKVKFWDRWGRPYFKTVAVSQHCFWTFGGPWGGPGNGPHPGPWNGPGPGPWNGPGNGPYPHH